MKNVKQLTNIPYFCFTLIWIEDRALKYLVANKLEQEILDTSLEMAEYLEFNYDNIKLKMQIYCFNNNKNQKSF